MHTLAHIRLGLERIALLISLVLCFTITVILVANFDLVGLIMRPFTLPLSYLILYILALVVPQCLAQLLLWVICAFRNIQYRSHLSPTLASVTLSSIGGLLIACVLLMASLSLNYFSSKTSAMTTIFVELLVAMVCAFWFHKKIRHRFSSHKDKQQ